MYLKVLAARCVTGKKTGVQVVYYAKDGTNPETLPRSSFPKTCLPDCGRYLAARPLYPVPIIVPNRDRHFEKRAFVYVFMDIIDIKTYDYETKFRKQISKFRK